MPGSISLQIIRYRERLCAWATHHGFSTGQADTIEQLLDELLPQIEERLGTTDASFMRMANAAMHHQWQPIETAPKDGTTFIASYISPKGSIQLGMAYWNSEWEEFKTDWSYPATHWIPMPKEPK